MISYKVHIFREGQILMRNFHNRFVPMPSTKFRVEKLYQHENPNQPCPLACQSDDYEIVQELQSKIQHCNPLLWQINHVSTKFWENVESQSELQLEKSNQETIFSSETYMYHHGILTDFDQNSIGKPFR